MMPKNSAKNRQRRQSWTGFFSVQPVIFRREMMISGGKQQLRRGLRIWVFLNTALPLNKRAF
jgi:hypothetical protein